MTDPPDAPAMSRPPDAAACIPSQEICDRRDNDCDGQIDDGVVVATGGFTALGSALQRISGSGSILTVCGSQPCGGTNCLQCAPLTITGATLSGEFAGSIKSVNATAGGLTVCGVVDEMPSGTVCTTISMAGASLSGGLSAYAITGLEVLGGVSGTTIAVSGLDQCPGGPGGDTTFTCPVSSTMTVACPF